MPKTVKKTKKVCILRLRYALRYALEKLLLDQGWQIVAFPEASIGARDAGAGLLAFGNICITLTLFDLYPKA